MGATGYQPQDDDAYHDFIGDVTKPIHKVLSRKVTSLSIYRHAMDWRAAARCVLVMAPLFEDEELRTLLGLAAEKLDVLVKADEFHEMYSDPVKIKLVMIEERDAFIDRSAEILKGRR